MRSEAAAAIAPSAARRVALAAARDAGASACSIVAATPDAVTSARMNESVARGDLATWGYDAAYAERASDPGAALNGARSVVCVAIAYATDTPRRERLRGRVSNYAWSRDYHSRVRAVLVQVAAALDALAGESCTRVACDTAPLAERAFAARAGLGWIGKHTNLINPQFGSFVFLGEVVTTLAIEPDAPLRKSCGSCRRCVVACPTGALRGDYTIDATRCISDLTQRTDGVPRELRPLVGDWVWGCDICQDVCPPTRRAGARGSVDFSPADAGDAAPDLLALLSLRSGEYKRRYRGTAMGWRGAAVLRRNAALALGNALDRSSVPALAVALDADPHPMVRGHAAWALGRIGSPRAVAALRRAEKRERDAGARSEIGHALGPFGNLPCALGVGKPEDCITR
jgi:epoxyqueuosine reductase